MDNRYGSRMGRALVLAAAMASTATGAAAEAIEGFAPYTARNKAIGGNHAALADDFHSYFANPACLAAAPRELYVARLGVRTMGPAFDIASAFIDSANMTTALVDLLADNDYKMYAGAEIGGPVSFGFVGGGLGFGLFNATRAVVNAASASSIGVSVAEDVLLTGGYAFRIDLGGGHALDMGIAAKGFARGEISESLGAIELIDLLDAPEAFLDLPFSLTTGVGFDAGMRWSWDGAFAAGLAYRDAYSPALVTSYDNATAFIADPASANPVSRNAVIDPDLSFGLAFTPRMGKLERFLDSVVVALDYRDILDLFAPLPRNPVLNLGLGLEVGALDIMTFRAGLSETLLTTGFGLDLGFMRFDFTVYGTELGIEPGQRPVYNMMAGFEFVY